MIDERGDDDAVDDNVSTRNAASSDEHVVGRISLPPAVGGEGAANAAGWVNKGIFEGLFDRVPSIMPEVFEPRSTFAPEAFQMPELDLSNSPQVRTAEHTQKVAEGTEALLELTRASLALSEQSRRDSERAERFSRRMTWTSVAIGGASLALAIASFVVAIVALRHS